MRQIPNYIQYYRDPSTLTSNTPYPEASGQYPNYAAEPLKGAISATWQEYVFFIPENRRGESSNTDPLTKNFNTVPAGQSPYCTYIEITGDYYSATTKVTTSVRYDILLGANNTNDYNLLRNRVYNIQTTIQGQDMTDTRVQSVIDYTDNQTGWFLIATADQPGLYDAAGCAVACPDGYRVPTKQELFIMYAVKPATGMTYATESDYRSDNNTYLTMEGKQSGLSYWRGTGGGASATAELKVRCVKDIVPAPAKKYPYVESGNIIVCRDAQGGIKDAGIHDAWTSVHVINDNDMSKNSGVSARFEVADSYAATNVNWSTGVYSCTSPWRVPTHREGMVIVALQNDLAIPSLGSFFTSVSGYQNNGHVVGQGFNASAQNKNAYKYNVRCVRDL